MLVVLKLANRLALSTAAMLAVSGCSLLLDFDASPLPVDASTVEIDGSKVIDAMPPDAMPPDAMPPDAALPDGPLSM